MSAVDPTSRGGRGDGLEITGDAGERRPADDGAPGAPVTTPEAPAAAVPASVAPAAGRPGDDEPVEEQPPTTDDDVDLDDERVPEDIAPNARPATRRRVWAIRRRRAKHKRRSKVFRIGYATIAFILVIGGLAIGPLPGPGPVILIPLGLAMLAAEFVWAERALAYALDKAEGAKEGAKETTAKQRVLIGFAVLCGIAAVVSAVYFLRIPIPFVYPNP